MTVRLPLAALLAASLFALPALAEGRTDGAEGSEVGHGGYTSSTMGRFSLVADFGGAIATTGPLLGIQGAPLYVGGTASLWFADWFKLDLLGNWVFNAQRLNVLLGPRFSTPTWPVSFGGALHAGIMYDSGGSVRFGLSPELSAEMLFARHFLAGLKVALDIPIGAASFARADLVTRIGIHLGWRF
jgi:hypothetical protein